jgi:hypothetical protein
MRRVLLVVFGLPAVAVGIAILGAIAGAGASAQACASSPEPVGGVPAQLVPLFQGAAARYDLGPEGAAILAAINSVESRFDSNEPGVRSGANSAGAAGPMQIGIGGRAGDTWATIKVNAPGDPPGQPPNVYDEADAVYSAAHYLALNGMTASPASWRNAVWHYDHADWYAQKVLTLAQTYAQSPNAAPTYVCEPAATIPGEQAEITPQGIALAPALAPVVVQELIAAGNQIIAKPYPHPDHHYGPLNELWPAYDCSGSTSYILYKADLLSDSALTSGQFTSWGLPGPGRWVTVYATSGHVFIEVAGIVLNTAWYAPVKPTTPPSGPRWQPASTISAQLRGNIYGPFSERHPAGF